MKTEKNNIKSYKKYLITQRKNNTKRYQTILSDKQITDQSYQNACDINIIMKQYTKTGVLPNYGQKTGQYLDLTNLPTFMEAHEIVKQAKEMFMTLPSQVRAMMHHDPKNLEAFLTDPENLGTLEKYGLVKEKPKAVGQSKQPEAAVGTAETLSSN